MASHIDSNIDIDARTWAQLMGLSVGDGTYQEIFEEAKIDDGAAVPVSQVKTKAGAIYGNKVGVVLGQLWDKARSGPVEVTGSDSFVSTGTNYADFASFGEVPEGRAWMVTGEINMAADNGSILYSGMVQFRATVRRRVGSGANATTPGTLTNGTGSPAITAVLASNTYTLQARLSGLGTVTVYRRWRYRIDEIVMP
jgi:hypothetical protein